MPNNRKRPRYDLTSVLYDKSGRVISTAVNRYDKSHPLQYYFAKKVNIPEAIYLHSEIHCLIKARGKKGHTMMVTRLGKRGTLKPARPCPICFEALKAFGIKQVKYSTKDGYAIEDVS